MCDSLDRWKENFSTLLNQHENVCPNASDQFKQIPMQEELFLPISTNELDQAIKATICGKSPELDGIPQEVSKHGSLELRS